MQIVGPWEPKMDELVYRLDAIGQQLEKAVLALPDSPVRAACKSLCGNLGAVGGTIVKLCKDTGTTCWSQPVGALVRTLMDSSISVFAFCMDRASRASLYLDYDRVLHFRRCLAALKYRGCPQLPASEYQLEEVKQRLAIAKHELRQCGEAYVRWVKETRNKTPAEILEMATRDGAEQPKWFRDHWWPEAGRREVLEYEHMGHLYDLIYTGLCSCVHSDVAAGGTFAGSPRLLPVMITLQFWGAGVLRLAGSLKISLGPDQEQLLRDVCYRPLQWTPERK